MRDPKRIKLMTDMLYQAWSKPQNQDLRLGQLLSNLHYRRKAHNDIFFAEDTEWLEWLMEECDRI